MGQELLFATSVGSAGTTTLDTPETSVDQGGQDLCGLEEPWAKGIVRTERHVKWEKRRKRVYEAMLLANVSYSRREAFRTCGAGFWVMQSRADPTSYRACPDFCHDRFCEPCQNLRSKCIREGLKAQLTADCYRFLTLTIRHTDDPLSDQLTHLYQSFRRLRSTKLWRGVVDGGIAFLELTYNVHTGQWHPHLHCILAGKWIPAAELAAKWKKATSGSHVIDIRLVRDKMQVATYVSKYATKAYTHRDNYPQSCLVEALHSLRGRRTVLSFGTQAPLKTKMATADGDWDCVCHANELATTERIDDETRKQLREWIQQVHQRKAQPVMRIGECVTEQRAPPF